jgi:tripartite-type tricarboxylate transporter receptor subunit TctC
VTLLAKVPMVFAVGPKRMRTTLPQFIAKAKAAPGKLNYGSAGNGSAGHLAFEMLKLATGIDVTHVPYKGTGAQMTDLLAGNIEAASAGLPGFLSQAKAGKLKILAVGSAKRLPAVPDVPTVAELGYPNFESSQWFGLIVPAKTPARRRHPAARRSAQGAGLAAGAAHGWKKTPAPRRRWARTSSRSFIASEQKRWGAVVRSAKADGRLIASPPVFPSCFLDDRRTKDS